MSNTRKSKPTVEQLTFERNSLSAERCEINSRLTEINAELKMKVKVTQEKREALNAERVDLITDLNAVENDLRAVVAELTEEQGTANDRKMRKHFVLTFVAAYIAAGSKDDMVTLGSHALRDLRIVEDALSL